MNNPYLIAVVDDDEHIRNLVEAYLQKENYHTIGLGSAEEAWTLWQTSPRICGYSTLCSPVWMVMSSVKGFVTKPKYRSL